MTPGKGGDDKDNPLHFSGEIKDFFARQVKDKTGSAATRKKALDHEKLRQTPRDRPATVPQQEPLDAMGSNCHEIRRAEACEELARIARFFILAPSVERRD